MYFQKWQTVHLFRRVPDDSGEKEYDETSPPPHILRSACLCGVNVSMPLVTYVCDDLAYLWISDLIRKGRPHFPKRWVYGELCQLKYMYSSGVAHAHSYITHTPLNVISGWVHMCTYCTCRLIDHIACYVSVLSLICSSWFGWFMSSHAQHVSLIRSPPLMPARLDQISLSFYLSLLPFSIPPPLFIHTGMCDMWISRQGVWYPCWALERRPNKKEVVKNNPAATSIHAPFITSLSLIQQLLYVIYFLGTSIAHGISARVSDHIGTASGFCFWVYLLFMNNPSRAHVIPR